MMRWRACRPPCIGPNLKLEVLLYKCLLDGGAYGTIDGNMLADNSDVQSAEQDCKQRHADFPIHTPIVIHPRCGRVGWALVSCESEASYEINELRFP